MNDMNNRFYLVYQPIIKYIDREKHIINDYEVLLRSKQTHQFPVSEFDELISSEEKNAQFLTWYVQKIEEAMSVYPDLHLSLNFHPEQWHYEATLILLKQLSNFSRRIIIDSTEHSPHRCSTTHLTFNHAMTELNQMGYKVSFDDVSTGINSMTFLLKNIEYIYRIKFSIIHFKSLNPITLNLFIDSWAHFADDYHIEFVIEGIEDQSFSLE